MSPVYNLQKACPARLTIRVVHGVVVEHECQLAAAHYPPHRCWCGWAFDPILPRLAEGLPWHDVLPVRPDPLGSH